MKKTWLELMEENPETKNKLLSLKAFCMDMTREEVETEYQYKLKESKNEKQ